jgi:para-nitrobenzyl esterase
MKTLLLISLFTLKFITASFAQGAGSDDPAQDESKNRVKLPVGIVEGLTDKNGIKSFKGIPFAAPPIGDLRWKAPAPVQAWSGVKKCTAFGPSPMQATPTPSGPWTEEFLIPKSPISEDCLYLNVWTNAKSAKEKKPVLVWIYGGGFGSGGSAVPIYDGAAMAKKGIVFVSINYRVGIFGFLTHPELTKESDKNASGNYGLMDQVAALQWVKENISAFGGDPGNVTVAGQSAGSISVNCLVASPLAKGLFQKAIAESGAALLPNSLRTDTRLKQAEEHGEKLLRSLAVNSIADLRKLSGEALLEKARFQAAPIVDGYVLPDAIASIFASGRQNDVVLLTGWNEDEGVLFGPLKNAADYQTEMKKKYLNDADAILKFYPAGSDAEAAASQLKISRDEIFGVQNYTWANLQSEQGKKVFVYRFARKVPATGEYVKYGAFHTGEVPYALDNLLFSNRPSEKSDFQLAKTMSSYWVNFITNGNPNGKDLPNWPIYTLNSKEIMIFDKISKAQVLPDKAALDLMYQTAKPK